MAQLRLSHFGTHILINQAAQKTSQAPPSAPSGTAAIGGNHDRRSMPSPTPSNRAQEQSEAAHIQHRVIPQHAVLLFSIRLDRIDRRVHADMKLFPHVKNRVRGLDQSPHCHSRHERQHQPFQGPNRQALGWSRLKFQFPGVRFQVLGSDLDRCGRHGGHSSMAYKYGSARRQTPSRRRRQRGRLSTSASVISRAAARLAWIEGRSARPARSRS